MEELQRKKNTDIYIEGCFWNWVCVRQSLFVCNCQWDFVILWHLLQLQQVLHLPTQTIAHIKRAHFVSAQGLKNSTLLKTTKVQQQQQQHCQTKVVHFTDFARNGKFASTQLRKVITINYGTKKNGRILCLSWLGGSTDRPAVCRP